MTNDIDLGARLRLAREAKGLRQEDVAKALEVSQQAVQSWEAILANPATAPLGAVFLACIYNRHKNKYNKTVDMIVLLVQNQPNTCKCCLADRRRKHD